MTPKNSKSLLEYANRVIRWLLARGYMPKAIADYIMKLYLSEEIQTDLDHAQELIDDQLQRLKEKIGSL